MKTTPEFQIAEEAVRAAGALLSKYYQEGVAIRSKATSDLVSDADVEAERAIAQVIRRAFPDHAVLGEEEHQADTQAEHLWVVDPLDGTTNFAHKIPHIAISLAYVHQGQVECGIVCNPLRDDWFTAIRGQGAFYNGQRAEVSEDTKLDQALIGVGFYYDRGAMMEATLAAIRDLFHQNIHGIRRFGTAALDLCMVGVGMHEAYFEYQLSPWDFAAGRLFVEEAGGKVTNAYGKPLPLSRSSILASNGRLHDSVLQIVRQYDQF